MDFNKFSKAIETQLALMTTAGTLVRANVNVDELWDMYLAAFPAGTNEIFRERQSHDCNCCKGFIRRVGSVLSITNDGTVMSVWDVDTDDVYGQVAKILADYVKSRPIADYYLSSEAVVGSAPTPDSLEKITWTHFHAKIPSAYVVNKGDLSTNLGELRTTRSVFSRGLDEFSLSAAEMVLELIDQGSLYRGSEFKKAVNDFIATKKRYDSMTDEQRVLFTWTEAKKLGMAARFRSTVIGTLVADISDGVDLDKAVASFEAKVAPQNYMRTSAIVSPRMVEDARKKVEDLGLGESLHRRFAVADDIPFENVLFTAQIEKPLDAFSELSKEAASKTPKTLSAVKRMKISEFISDVLPTATSIEALVENVHIPHLMTLVAPANPDAPLLFKWDNGISWAYNGDITDSIKERVKRFGGDVCGDLRISLSWYNADDLDLSVSEPGGRIIDYTSKRSLCGELDLDMNGIDKHSSTEPVENVIYKNKSKMRTGTYTVIVDQFNKRVRNNEGFVLQVEFDGKIHNFVRENIFNNRKTEIIKIEFDGTNFAITDVNTGVVKPSTAPSVSKEEWGLTTNTFVPVKMILKSPNFWGDNQVGNEHTFFILDGCKTDEPVRGYFNEYLRSDLTQHRKVFEILGSKTKATPTNAEQMSGLGFSNLNEDTVTLRVTGKTKRTIIVEF